MKKWCLCSPAQQRGKVKEDNFVEMMRMLLLEEERLRNPLAQGLPLTTDEPEVPKLYPSKFSVHSYFHRNHES